MPAVQISAVIITFNEERNIGRCIESLAGLADEIVVLDSGSTDQTRSICASRGVKFHSHPFDDYAAQKNRATALANHDIILSLDADEAPSEELHASIFAVKQNWTVDACQMNRLTQYCGTWVRHSGWYPDTKLRLYDRRLGSWTGVKIHEKITMQAEAKVINLKGDLLHYSFYTIEQHMATVNKFSSLKAELMQQNGRGTTLVHLFMAPVIKFIKDYVIKRGFLDGSAGLNIAVNSAHGEYLKHAKLRELRKG